MPSKKPAHHPHDKYFKAILSMKRAAVELLQYGLSSEVFAELDLETLRPSSDSFIDEKLRESFSDIIYECNLKDGKFTRLCFLIEHKSEKPNSPISLQLLRYSLSILEEDLRQNRDYALTIPIVVYHGVEKWQKERLSSLYGDLSTSLRDFVPDFDYIFINISAKPDAELMSLDTSLIGQVFMLLKYIRRRKKIEDILWEIFNFASANSSDPDFHFYFNVTVQYISFTSSYNKNEIRAMIQGKMQDDDRDWSQMSSLELLYDKEELDAIKLEVRLEGELKGKLEGEIKAIKAILTIHPEWSNHKIADLLEVTEVLVDRIRHDLGR